MIENLDKYIIAKEKSEKKVIIGGILIILGVLCLVFFQEIGVFLVIGFGAPGIIICGIGFSDFMKLSKSFKSEVLTGLVNTFVDNGRFDPHSGLSQSQVYSTEFVKRADRFHTEDYLQGSMEGVEFVSSDVKLEERHVEHTKNGTRTYYETYFLGRIFIFEFNKSFAGYLQVLERARPTKKRGYKKVKLESVKFNKKFKTYATSEHSAFYVLTPHFMEALMQFEQKNKGNIYFSFLGSKLYIGINNFRDTFELRMFSKLNQGIFEEFKRDLLVIKDVVTELKLNNNIFKKE
jgi:hypothetical protein